MPQCNFILITMRAPDGAIASQGGQDPREVLCHNDRITLPIRPAGYANRWAPEKAVSVDVVYRGR